MNSPTGYQRDGRHEVPAWVLDFQALDRERTEIAGVSIPSPKNRQGPRPRQEIVVLSQRGKRERCANAARPDPPSPLLSALG
jgi:hypothetical protein